MGKVFFLTSTNSKNLAKMKRDGRILHEIIQEIIKEQRVPFELTLNSEATEDYLSNNCSLTIVSKQMKQLIDENTTECEGIFWLDVTVNSPTKKLIFYLLTFIKQNDVLDKLETIYVQNTNHVVKPVFDVNLIKDINVFTDGDSFNWQITSGVFITERLKKAIQKAKLTGIKFEQVATNASK